MTLRPLQNRKIVITRNARDAGSMRGALQKLGAATILFPTIRIEQPDDWKTCDAVLNDLSRYDWVLFSSQNSVRFFFQRLREKNIQMPSMRCAALGEKTDAELKQHGAQADFIPEQYSAAGFLREFVRKEPGDKKILMPVSNIARPELYEGLKRAGARPEKIVVYRTVPDRTSDPSELRAQLVNGKVDCLTFFSPSAFTYFIEIFGRAILCQLDAPSVAIAAIGATTAGAMKEAGIDPEIVPEKSTEDHMVRAIAEYYNRKLT